METNAFTLAAVLVLGAVGLAIVFAIVQAVRRPKRARRVERVVAVHEPQLTGLGGLCAVVLVVANAAALVSGGNFFQQAASLLGLIAVNQVLVLGVLAGRRVLVIEREEVGTDVLERLER